MTPSTVGLVLVEGREADGATVDHDAFDIRGHSLSLTGEICDQVVAAVRRTEKVAAEQGRRLTTIGVTWSSGAGAEAAVLLKKLTDAGFADVVPVRLPQATDALARRVAGIVGFGTTGVCVLEPDVVQAMTVGGHNPVQTTVSRGIETVAGLIEWLSDMFDAAEPRPDALVVIGSAVDLDSVLPKLEQALAVPVFTPAEPGLPLARGAALASARRGRRAVGGDSVVPKGWRWPASQLTPLAILVGGVVAFAVSLSLAIGQQLIPGPESTPHRTTRPVVSTSGDSASVHQTPAVESPAPPPPMSEAPPELEPVVESVQPDYVVGQTGTAPTEDTASPDALLAPPAPGTEPVPPEPQPQLSEASSVAPPPELAQQSAPASQMPPAPPPEAVVPPAPPATEAAPPVPAAVPPSTEAVSPAPESQVPVPVTP
ncbi:MULTISPECIES: hypothetical protein [unclassified Mycolicibacterium]|uniref:DUF7159 family protein n=1 Tax=unclassified Mycolicibacterium TaxID=2636767 RepID=UPI0012DC700B|nr:MULTISPECIES: hypothetical protein [unclassified Mycolicibacterium]MUM26909.1 hypothetical protein [Mycolicibacterium sp. CBMA 295]MUL85533.1 hypothetical protein [Mycolicibacterium sp. CBMA 329]MUL88703.1 hypothetical protein [Mycolicibacterium sp. CBMA 331]MUM02003.1 hypothetical protein [Mycolicibacterium sp. CBMA 334]MUM40350.1 hypothetical protein [Mycolicibacterium sp. CBMA 247]